MNILPAASLPTSHATKHHWGQLVGSALSLAITQAAQQHSGPVLLATEDTPTALKLEAELKSFCDALKLPVLTFPDWETLPWDWFSPHQDIISQRLQTMYQLTSLKKGIVIVPVNTLMTRTAPVSYIKGHTLIIKTGDRLDLHQMRQQLEKAGYNAVSQVMEHGEFSARGSLLDLFPMGTSQPFRLDFFDDEIDSIKLFDPETQRSDQAVKHINLLPAHEFPTDEPAIERFRKNYRDKFNSSVQKESVYHQVSHGIFPAGIEYYLPLFHEETGTLLDFFPENTLFITFGNLHNSADLFWKDVVARHENRNVDPLRPLINPVDMYLPVEELFSQIKQRPQLAVHQQAIADQLNQQNAIDWPVTQLPDITINHQLKSPFAALSDYIAQAKKRHHRVLFSVESEGRLENLTELLKRPGIKLKVVKNTEAFLTSGLDVAITISQAEQSFVYQDEHHSFSFITEVQLLGHRVAQRRKRKKDKDISPDAIVKNLMELTPGQPVVHIDHGVGRYQGLQTLDIGGMTAEFLTLIYADDAKLYVPVSSLHLISRYTGADAEHAPLNKLGSEAWEKAKRKAAEKIRDVAAELLDIYASRAAKKGYQYDFTQDDYLKFCSGFPFETTHDQQTAIDSVLEDMRSDQPMDRLVCGDVGFGKTEVAMRAAFTAVNDGKQVAVLVPTTLLAQQHFENFQDRFASWPVKIALLSRFKTAKEQKEAIKELEEGKVDIVIGTHKLLNADVKYQDLGLLVVDEEHRFGVRQKEKIKALRANVDILTLTATPIPRTLNMAMSGMRDLSVIATAPARRLAIKTFVRQYDDAIVKEAVLREIKRGGQVYFLHNNVETINKTAEHLEALIPEANIVVAHGQMRERELEQIMSDFYHQRFNVLVCTTIIETGIDVPSANTIIMDRADHLGLAQLHQLRGRVGRSHHQAYAYMLTPHKKLMTKDAVKRLEAIENLEDLGSGFMLATHDLEIRGAGELLGDEQSGQITSVGFSLYMDMLDEAVKALKEGKEPSLDRLLKEQTEVELRLPALLPDDYITDINHRLAFYKRIASLDDEREMDEIRIELIDRFGLLPDATKNLFTLQQLKIAANEIGIKKIELGPKGGYVQFRPNTKVSPVFIVSLVQVQPTMYRMEGADKLKISLDLTDVKDRIKYASSLVNDFREKAEQ